MMVRRRGVREHILLDAHAAHVGEGPRALYQHDGAEWWQCRHHPGMRFHSAHGQHLPQAQVSLPMMMMMMVMVMMMMMMTMILSCNWVLNTNISTQYWQPDPAARPANPNMF